MSIGGIDMSGCENNFKVTKEYTRILGVNIGVNAKEARDATWTGILNKKKTSTTFLEIKRINING